MAESASSQQGLSFHLSVATRGLGSLTKTFTFIYSQVMKQGKYFSMQKGKVYWQLCYRTFLGIFYNIYCAFFLIIKGIQYHSVLYR